MLLNASDLVHESAAPTGHFAPDRPEWKILIAPPAELRKVHIVPDSGSGSHTGPFEPADIRNAYGIDNVLFGNGSITGDGSGQTIAVVDPYSDPNIASDLDAFDNLFSASLAQNAPSLYTQYGAASSFFSIYQPYGAPPAAPTGDWAEEMSLDVEWAHAIAPAAKIVLVEAQVGPQGADLADLFNAVEAAADYSGVSAVSMSWGAGEFNGETSDDSVFTTPSGHSGVTFVAATGDTGSPGQYPAYSPNVLAVGGTNLSLGIFGNDLGESGWSGSGGGISQYESEPSYQSGVQSTNKRTIPDVALNAGNSMYFYDSYDFGGSHLAYGTGTSFDAPMWSAMIAIADQGRAAASATAMDGATQTLPNLYAVPSSHFYDITSGSNGSYSAGPGYDEVTGRGTPNANEVLPNLVPRKIAIPSVQYGDGAQVAANGNLTEQDLFVVGSDGLVREDKYFQSSNHQATGSVIVDPSMTFAAGTKITVYNDGQSINLFAVGTDGHPYWDQYTSNGGWTGFQKLKGLEGLTFAAGTEFAEDVSNGSFQLYAIQTNGYMADMVYSGSGPYWGIAQWASQMSSGTPLSIYTDGSSIYLFGVLSNGNVDEWTYSAGNWNLATINASFLQLVNGTQLTLWGSGSFIDLYGVNSAGNISRLYYSGGWNEEITNASGANLSPGAPVVVNEANDILYSVYGVNSSGSIGVVQPTNGYWSGSVIAGSSGFTTGSQVSLYVSGSVQDLFGVASGGDLLAEEYNGSAWTQFDLAAALTASTVQYGSGEEVAANGNLSTQDLFVVGADGLVRENQYFESQTAATGQVIVDPVMKFAPGTKITVYNDGQSINLFAVGTDGHAYWDQYTTNGGWTGFSEIPQMSALTFAPGTEFAEATNPTSFQDGVFQLFAIETDGDMANIVYFVNSHQWGIAQWASQMSSGTPLSIYTDGSEIYLFGVLSNGNVGQWSYTNANWNFATINASFDQLTYGTQLAVYGSGSGSGTYMDLYGVNSSGNIGRLTYSSGSWSEEILSASGAGLTAGTPLAVYEVNGVLEDLYGVNSSGSIGVVKQTNGIWGGSVIAGSSGFAIGSQVSLYVSGSVQDIFGLATTSDLLAEQYNGSTWTLYDLS